MRLQSQQMLDQIHGDEPLETSGTGPVDGDNESSESEEDPCERLKSERLKKIHKNRVFPEIPGSNSRFTKCKDLNNADTVQNGNSMANTIIEY